MCAMRKGHRRVIGSPCWTITARDRRPTRRRLTLLEYFSQFRTYFTAGTICLEKAVNSFICPATPLPPLPLISYYSSAENMKKYRDAPDKECMYRLTRPFARMINTPASTCPLADIRFLLFVMQTYNFIAAVPARPRIPGLDLRFFLLTPFAKRNNKMKRKLARYQS